MTSITLNIPTSTHKPEDIKNALESFVTFSLRHPEDMEDILLGMRMRETDDEEMVSFSQFLSSL